MAAAVEAQAPTSIPQDAVGDVTREPSTFRPATSDYQPKSILITGGAGFIVSSKPRHASPLPDNSHQR